MSPSWLMRSCSVAILLCLSSTASLAGELVTFDRLLEEMVDLPALCEFPDPPFTCKQFSSYDRRAKSPTEDWFANADAGHFVRIEEHEGRKERVLMDARGPGAVVRIWSANPSGTLRVYLDNHDVPALVGPMRQLLGGEYPGIPAPIAGKRSMGWNLYLPIPYAKHCKITSDVGGFYYHVGYRTYAEGTAVRTFDASGLQQLAETISLVADRLHSPRLGGGPPPTRSRHVFNTTVPFGHTATLLELTGPAAICELTFDTEELTLRSFRHLVLQVVFDGEQTVEVPLGDFFGSSPGLNPYTSLPLGMSASGELWSHWFMPFRQAASMRIVNYGRRETRIKGAAGVMPYTWTDRSMHFNAGWKCEYDAPAQPHRDWNYLTARGKGVFVGAAFSIAHPSRDWWGEGDEKIYVDGEKFPSHFGTGTEDYYGYAWCCPRPFTHAYHNQTRCDGPQNYGNVSVNRFHILDRIPFTSDFRFDMELWMFGESDNDISVATYWYARPSATDAYPTVTNEHTWLSVLPPYGQVDLLGVIEAEHLRIRSRRGDADPRIFLPHDREPASGGYLLEWHAGVKRGDQLDTEFYVPRGGTYHVYVRPVEDDDAGVVRFFINGRAGGESVDLFRAENGMKLADEIDLGRFELEQGPNRFAVEVLGMPDEPDRMFEIGLDYIRPVMVKPQK